MSAEPLIRVRGQGPDLVMLHGWGMSDACWGAFADRLSRGFRLHLVTLPGHGDDRDTDWSADQLIARVIARTPPAAWLGWSLGGTLALIAALAHSQQVKRLVMVAATPCFVAREDWPHGVLPFEFERFEARCRDDSADTLRRYRSRVADGGPNPSAVMLVLQQAPVAGHQALLAGLSVLADTDQVAALADLEVAGLWISGGRDRVIRPEAVSTAARRHASGQLLTLAHAGHAPHLDHPELLADKVGGWLAGEVAA